MKSDQRAPLRVHKPSREEDNYIRNGVAFLNMTFPLCSNIFYGEMDLKYTHDVPWAATDSHDIFFNARACMAAGWDVEEVAFVIAHEGFHYILADLIQAMGWRAMGYVIIDNHGGTLPYVHSIMNRAQDYRINAMLIEGKVGRMPKIGLYDPAISLVGMESCIEIYAKLYHKYGEGGLGDGFDIHIEPTDEMVKEEQGMGSIRRAQAIAAAVQAAEASGMGTLPSAIRRMIGEILDPKVKWQDHLKATMQRAAGEPRHDWSKVNKRLISRPERIVFARKSNYGCGAVVVGWDTSGSTHSFQDIFFSEMAGIVADLNPTELIVIRCDAAVHNVDRLEDPTDLNDYRKQVNDDGVGGGGGTRFEPVFQYIKDNHIEPDMVVYLTDTMGSFPKEEPSYPVIWASILRGRKVPFGHLVEIETD
jgi:VWA-like domain (DUF2201)/Putative metallopeptidase domain